MVTCNAQDKTNSKSSAVLGLVVSACLFGWLSYCYACSSNQNHSLACSLTCLCYLLLLSNANNEQSADCLLYTAYNSQTRQQLVAAKVVIVLPTRGVGVQEDLAGNPMLCISIPASAAQKTDHQSILERQQGICTQGAKNTVGTLKRKKQSPS